jgi:uncharacterized membrane protein YdjX (TVP38/TMEM64 family)
MTDDRDPTRQDTQIAPRRDTFPSSPSPWRGLGWWLLRDYLSFSALAENREALIAFRDANYIGTVAVFIAVYALIVAFSLPGATIATLTGGFLFATFPGALFNITAATIGATAIFLAAQTSFGARLGAARRLRRGGEEDQGRDRREPVVDAVPDAPGAGRALLRRQPHPRLPRGAARRFVISTFFGIMPGAVVYTSVGAGLGEVFARGETPNLGIIFEPHILLPILGLAALAVLPILIKALRGKKGL